jgi:UDP-N-acetyl-D-mannosaminuronate dehydrogenase
MSINTPSIKQQEHITPPSQYRTAKVIENAQRDINIAFDE